MTHEEVRDQLAEYLLGGLDEVSEQAIARHLRGCGPCRQELASLSEGVSTFARAAHELDPPEELRGRVLGALSQERKGASPAEAPASGPTKRPWRMGILAWAAAFVAVVLLSGSLATAVVASGRAADWHAEASKYEAFLGALGGSNVRTAKLNAPGTQQLEGTLVLYDSTKGQSWGLVLVHAPGLSGSAHVTLHSATHTIEMRPLEFESSGDASTWLVTGADLRPFNAVTITQHGSLLASGTVTSS
ncbi:MAG: zf-HC2 domain-containing protein [Actinomycetota bacterium]